MLVRALIWNPLSPSSGMDAADSNAASISKMLFTPQFGCSASESNWDTSSSMRLTPALSRAFEGLTESERIPTSSQLKTPLSLLLDAGSSGSSPDGIGSAPMIGSSLRYSSPSYIYLRRTSAMNSSASSSERTSYVFSESSLSPMSSSSSSSFSSSGSSSGSSSSVVSEGASGVSVSAVSEEGPSSLGASLSTNMLPEDLALPSLHSFAMASLTITCDASGNAKNSRSRAHEPPFASSSSSI